MFNEDEDWNDEQEAQVVTKAALKKVDSSTNVKAKVVGKKSLLRTLQALGSVPEWKGDGNDQRDSDSDTEKPKTKPKRKKKRSKRRKKAETAGEQPAEVDGDKDQSVKEDKPVPKKKIKVNKYRAALKAKKASVDQTQQEDGTQASKANVATAERSAGALSRQQWKNKMKNKRKCNNKFAPEKPAEEVNKAQPTEKPEAKEDVKNYSHSNSSSNNKDKNSRRAPPAQKKKKEPKPQKRKKMNEDTAVSCTTLTQTLEEQTNTAVESPSHELKVENTKDEPPAAKRLKPQLSKEQLMKREVLRKMLQGRESADSLERKRDDEPAVPKDEEEKESEVVPMDRSASLRCRMQQRLESARFRYINELLYSTTSGEARRMFKQDPEAFGVYHRGYTAQVQRWPANPVDAIIADIQKKPPSLVVADFGCGDCKIARSVKNKVHSFDLASTCDLVTVCDMANVPLKDNSVDIAVFCLSLMGTNLADFLAEANRVLKMRGVLKIAEVASRFENVRSFVTGLANLGFKMVSKDAENTHFHSFELEKTANAPENVKKFGLELRPCVYKKR